MRCNLAWVFGLRRAKPAVRCMLQRTAGVYSIVTLLAWTEVILNLFCAQPHALVLCPLADCRSVIWKVPTFFYLYMLSWLFRHVGIKIKCPDEMDSIWRFAQKGNDKVPCRFWNTAGGMQAFQGNPQALDTLQWSDIQQVFQCTSSTAPGGGGSFKDRTP